MIKTHLYDNIHNANGGVTMPELKIENVFMYYAKRKNEAAALSDVSLRLVPGFYGLLGPNGSGKSTLINIIIGNMQPTSGNIYWEGENIKALARNYRKILGYMPQQQTLYPSFSGQHFLCYMAALKMIDAKQICNEVLRVADIVHLKNELKKRIAAYSGGMKQRLLIAAALLGNPKLIIMDEPTAGLDPKERASLRNLLASYAHNSVVLVATHVVSDVEQKSNGIILLRKGEIVDYDSSPKLVEKHNASSLEDVYLAIFGGDEFDTTG